MTTFSFRKSLIFVKTTENIMKVSIQFVEYKVQEYILNILYPQLTKFCLQMALLHPVLGHM